jgi:hypothetical protein
LRNQESFFLDNLQTVVAVKTKMAIVSLSIFLISC